MKIKKKRRKKKEMPTSKQLVLEITRVCLFFIGLSYVLAFMGREQIAESLSSTIVDAVIPIVVTFLVKSLAENYSQHREERLNKIIDNSTEQEVIE